jgi:hypothetical protein
MGNGDLGLAIKAWENDFLREEIENPGGPHGNNPGVDLIYSYDPQTPQ